MVSISGLIIDCTAAHERLIKCMEKEFLNGQMGGLFNLIFNI